MSISVLACKVASTDHHLNHLIDFRVSSMLSCRPCCPCFHAHADMCQDPRKILDPGSQNPKSRMSEDFGSCISIFTWDLRDLGFCHSYIVVESQGSWISDGKMSLDPGDPRSSLGRLSWDLADLGSCTTIMPLCLEDRSHPMKLYLWFHISLRCLYILEHLLRISSTY